jgi:hypothetical protein
MTKLIKYDAACLALAAAKSVDEVKEYLSGAAAIEAYARQAKNKEMEADAVEIRLRVKRRLGEMMKAQPKQTGGHAMKVKARVVEKSEVPISLTDAGIDKNLAHESRTLASLSPERFEKAVSDARDATTRVADTVAQAVEAEAKRQAKAAERQAKLKAKHLSLPPDIQVLQGDCREVLATLADQSVHCVVTSPPYFGLRDFGTAEWEGGDPRCNHRTSARAAPKERGDDRGDYPSYSRDHEGIVRDNCPMCGARRIDRQVGVEASVEGYVTSLVDIFREVRRVLRDDGTVWLNIGDSYFPAQNSVFPSCGQ